MTKLKATSTQNRSEKAFYLCLLHATAFHSSPSFQFRPLKIPGVRLFIFELCDLKEKEKYTRTNIQKGNGGDRGFFFPPD